MVDKNLHSKKMEPEKSLGHIGKEAHADKDYCCVEMIVDNIDMEQRPSGT